MPTSRAGSTAVSRHHQRIADGLALTTFEAISLRERASLTKVNAMRSILCLLLLSIPLCGEAQVFRCGEPKGVGLWSTEQHKPVTDGFTGVRPLVILEGKAMTVVWGDAESAGGAEKVWKPIVVHRSAESVSGVAIDTSDASSAVMLFTVDLQRGFLYLSAHKEGLDRSAASSFVSACSR